MKIKKIVKILAMMLLFFGIIEKSAFSQAVSIFPVDPFGPPQQYCDPYDYVSCSIGYDEGIKCRNDGDKHKCGFVNPECDCRIMRYYIGFMCNLREHQIGSKYIKCPTGVGTCSTMPSDDMHDACIMYPNPELYTDNLFVTKSAQQLLLGGDISDSYQSEETVEQE